MNIGSLWAKKTQDGKKYLSGVIQSPFLPGGELRIAIFPVKEKKSENSPDYSVVWSIMKKDASAKVEEKFGEASPFNDDDLPF